MSLDNIYLNNSHLGLSAKDLRRFRDLLIKANDQQLSLLMFGLNKEINMRKKIKSKLAEGVKIIV